VPLPLAGTWLKLSLDDEFWLVWPLLPCLAFGLIYWIPLIITPVG